MDFERAQEEFCKIKDSLGQEDMASFFMWIQGAFLTSHCRGQGPAIAHHTLRDIAHDIRSMLPFNAILPSENIHQTSKQSEGVPTVHVDAFLYDEMDLDELVEEGKFSRNFCKDCGSRNVAPLNFETHSASINRLDIIFSSLVPWIPDQTVLDVGSRLGSVLYGAYVYSKAKRIIGVEMNEDFCKIQKNIIEKHQMGDRIEVVCADIINVPELVSSADVVVVNNSFECFLSTEVQGQCWRFLSRYIKAGAKLVTSPSLATSFKNLELPAPVQLESWVRKARVDSPLLAMTLQDQDEMSEVTCYEVLAVQP